MKTEPTLRSDLMFERRLQEEIEAQMTCAYDRLCAHMNFKPDRSVFRTVALRCGMGNEDFDIWAETRKWAGESQGKP